MVLLTGATGIIGSHILIELLKLGKNVRVLVRANSSTKAIDQLLSFHGLNKVLFEYVEGDVNDIVSVNEAMEGCDEVYHCAAIVSFNPKDAESLYTINVKGTENLVNSALALNVRAFGFVSSTAAIGDQKVNGKQTETSTWTTDKGKSDYSLSKHYAELEVWRGAQEGLNVAMVNPGVVIGPGKWGQSSTSLFKSCKSGMRFYPSGSNGFVDARDVAETLVSFVEQKHFNQRYLMIGEHLSFKELFLKLCEAMNAPKPSIAIPKAPVLLFSKLIKPLELLGFAIPGLTSENMKSAYRTSIFDTERARAKGINFRTIDEAIAYTKQVQPELK